MNTPHSAKITQPYPGLRPFERHESKIFFGREQQIDDLLARLKQRHFLAVLGASGSGKSSLVKAGLLPALAKGYMGEVGTRWSIAELRPGAAAFERLAEALLKDLSFRRAWLPAAEAAGPTAQAFLAAALRRGPLSLHEILAAKPLPPGTRLLLLIDQFEELFRYRSLDENQAAAFAALLLAAVGHADIYVVITMRSDFLGRAAEFLGLPEAINNGLYLTPRLNRAQLAAAIAKPALLFGGRVEDALVNALCNETGHDPDQLPLLQHALMRLWRQDPALKLRDYARLGGLKGALDGHAEEAWDSLAEPPRSHAPRGNEELARRATDPRRGSTEFPPAAWEPEKRDNIAPSDVIPGGDVVPSEAQRIAARLFRALTERGGAGLDMRRPVQAAEILSLAETDLAGLAPVVEAFSQAGRNFLMLSPPGALTAETLLDISHESLIRQWQRLQAWVAEEADQAAMFQRLSEAARRHARLRDGRRMGEYWRGTDLALALEWRDEQQPTAAWARRYGITAEAKSDSPRTTVRPALAAGRGPAEAQAPDPAAQAFQQAMDFLDESVAEEQKQIAAQAAAQQEKIQILQQAEQKLAASLFDSKLTHASLLARVEDYAGAKALLQQTRELDQQVAASRRHARNLLQGFAQLMGGEADRTYRGAGVPLLGNLELSPDGYWLAAGGERGQVALFENDSGKLNLLPGHDAKAGDTGAVFGIAFHPSQPWLYSGGKDGRIIRWQLPQDGQAAQPLQQWNVEAGDVNSLAVSPDGGVLASGHDDGGIRLWQADSGKLIRTLTGHQALIAAGFGLAFSPDGAWLASASYDQTAKLWDWRKGKKALQTLQGHTDNVLGLAFSPDSRQLATASQDHSIRLWDAQTGKAQRVLQGHRNNVFGLRFIPGPGAGWLASASDDTTIRLWDVASGTTLRILQGHSAGVGGLALGGAPAGLALKVAAQAAPAGKPAPGPLFSASNDGSVKRWPLELPELLRLPSEPASTAIAPEGRHVVVGFADGSLRVYALETGTVQSLDPPGPLLRLAYEQTGAHGSNVKRLVFDASGQHLASAGFDNLAKLWRYAADGSLKLEKTYAGHLDAVHGLAFSADGQRLASASYDGQIGLFALADDAQILFPAHKGRVASVSFDPTGQFLLSAGEDRQLKLWDLTSQPPRIQQRFPSAEDKLLWASLSADGRSLAAVGREQIVRVYPVSGAEGYPLQGHEQTVFKALFSPDSRQLATVSGDRTLRLWDLDARAELFRLRLPTEISGSAPLWDFDFRCTPSGCWIAVPLVRGVLAVYKLGPYED